MPNLVIRAIDDRQSPMENMEMDTQRSRWVCLICTAEVRGLVICDGPKCQRCTRQATLQQTIAPGQAIPEAISPEAKSATAILARHQAAGSFRIPPKAIPKELLK